MGVSTFFGLNVGTSALEAMNQAESVTANNLANQNTPGYVQETTNFGELSPYPPAGETSIAGQIGTGVNVESVTRQTSAFISQQDRLNQGTYQMYSTHSSGLTQIQSILNEPSSNSIQNSLDQFFASWQSLSSDPSNTSDRQGVISQAEMLSQTFSTVTQQLEQMASGLNTTVGNPNYYMITPSTLTTASSTTSVSSTGLISSDINFLSALTTTTSQNQLVFTAANSSTGTLSYSVQLETNGIMGTAVPITQSGTYTLTNSSGLSISADIPNPSSLIPSGTVLSTGATYTLAESFTTPDGGQLSQLNDYVNQVSQLNQQIESVNATGENPNTLLDQRSAILDSLSQMANISYTQYSSGAISLTIGATQVINANGVVTPFTQADLSQVTSGSIQGNQQSIADANNLLTQLNQLLTQFSSQVNTIQSTGYGLVSMTPNTATANMFNVNTDSFGNVQLSFNSNITASDVAAASSPGQPGDNSNAMKMIQLQNEPIYNNGTLDQGIAQMVSNIGIEANSTTSSEDTANALMQQSSSMRQSISGVDANQQEALMVEYQNTFSAAAKFIGIVDSMLQTLIGMVS